MGIGAGVRVGAGARVGVRVRVTSGTAVGIKAVLHETAPAGPQVSA